MKHATLGLLIGTFATGCWPSAGSQETAEAAEASEPEVHDWNEDTDDSDDDEPMGTLLVWNHTSWRNTLEYFYCYDGDPDDCWWTLDGVRQFIEPGESWSVEIPEASWFIYALAEDGEDCAAFSWLDGIAGEQLEIELTEELFVYTHGQSPC